MFYSKFKRLPGHVQVKKDEQNLHYSISDIGDFSDLEEWRAEQRAKNKEWEESRRGRALKAATTGENSPQIVATAKAQADTREKIKVDHELAERRRLEHLVAELTYHKGSKEPGLIPYKGSKEPGLISYIGSKITSLISKVWHSANFSK